jgi:hypothetical protein
MLKPLREQFMQKYSTEIVGWLAVRLVVIGWRLPIQERGHTTPATTIFMQTFLIKEVLRDAAQERRIAGRVFGRSFWTVAALQASRL